MSFKGIWETPFTVLLCLVRTEGRKLEEQLVSLNTEVEIFGVTRKQVSLECWKKLNRRCSLTSSADLVDWNCKVLSANLSLCAPATSERHRVAP